MSNKRSQTKDKDSAMELLKNAGEQRVQELKEKVDAVVTQAQQAKQEVLDSVDDARRRVEAAKRQVEEQAEQQKQAAVHHVDQVSDLLHTTGSELQAQYDHYEEQLGNYAEAAADEIDQIAQRLKDRHENRIVQTVRRLVRRRPGLALGIVLTTGFLIGRSVQRSTRGMSQSDRQGRRGNKG